MMLTSTGFSLSNIDEGQAKLAHVIKILVDRSNATLLERLDINDDRIFLEPLLFAYFNSSDAPLGLEQILFGYTDDDKKSGEIEVYADENGIVHLPGIGYLKTNWPEQKLTLWWNYEAKTCILQRGSQRVDYELQDPVYVDSVRIEKYRYNHPLLKQFYLGPDGNPVSVDVTDIGQDLVRIGNAFRTIQACCSGYHQEIMAVARTIVVFRNDQVRPFVTISAHGTIFLSSNNDATEIFFLAEIIHQFGHNVLNAVLVEAKEYFRVDPMTPVAAYTGDESDRRTVLSAFHGLYTTAKTAQCIDTIADCNVYTGLERYELIGRLADNADRVTTGLETIDRSGLLTERGEALFDRFKQICHDVYRRRAKELAHLDTSNQPFVFDYDLFLQRNPYRDHEQKQ